MRLRRPFEVRPKIRKLSIDPVRYAMEGLRHNKRREPRSGGKRGPGKAEETGALSQHGPPPGLAGTACTKVPVDPGRQPRAHCGLSRHDPLAAMIALRAQVNGVGNLRQVMRETKVASDPDVLVAFFKRLGFQVARIGLEAGPQPVSERGFDDQEIASLRGGFQFDRAGVPYAEAVAPAQFRLRKTRPAFEHEKIYAAGTIRRLVFITG